MKRITLYHHKDCGRCRRIARVHRFFDWLDHPVERVTGGEASPSISKVLEAAAIANADDVAAKLAEMTGR